MPENLLARETSPYLLQHKDNPVAWHPWGPEALARAKAENKPILLSIGYTACHWCHVMAHESFENPEIASLMNELFVNIKVDREERPDIDSIYQSALALLGQQGGWPLTMFLTPKGEPFWGGTYFPPAERWGRPGFPQVLETIAGIYRDEPDKVTKNVAALKGVEIVTVNTPKDLDKARDVAARHGAHPTHEPHPDFRVVVAGAAGTFVPAAGLAVGDEVGAGQVIGSISTRQGPVEVSAHGAGVLAEWLAHDDDPVAAGQPLARIGGAS